MTDLEEEKIRQLTMLLDGIAQNVEYLRSLPVVDLNGYREAVKEIKCIRERLKDLRKNLLITRK